VLYHPLDELAINVREMLHAQYAFNMHSKKKREQKRRKKIWKNKRKSRSIKKGSTIKN
jgi:hypothetical protein